MFGYSNAGIALEDVMCNGSESSLEYCTTSPINVITVSQCQDETTNSAGVVCSGTSGTSLCIIVIKKLVNVTP